MHDGGISIWFFIGISLLVNGVLIVQAAIREILHPPPQPVVLFQYHANLWWGLALFLIGLFYCIKFKPQRHGKPV
jgi:FtsH-binding integral membrane protein